MQITRQSEYAIRAVMELASVPPGTVIHSRAIAEKQGLPEKFLHKTIQLLTRAGLVESRRGRHGGIKLVASPESITILDVINAVEGRVAINPCLADGYYCQNKPTCRVNKILKRAQDAMLAELQRETMAELVKNADSCTGTSEGIPVSDAATQ